MRSSPGRCYVGRDRKLTMFEEMRQAMGEKPTEQPQDDYREPTERLQSADTEPMKDYRVRLPESWWRELRERGAAEGLKPSQVIRRLVAAYLGVRH